MWGVWRHLFKGGCEKKIEKKKEYVSERKSSKKK